MTYKSLENTIKEAVMSDMEKSVMAKVKSLKKQGKTKDLNDFMMAMDKDLRSKVKKMLGENTNLEQAILEGGHTLVEQTSQVTVGDYTTKHFDICPSAVKLYSNISGKTPMTHLVVETMMLHDILFRLEKQVIAQGSADEDDVEKAEEFAELIMDNAEQMGLEDEHSYIEDVHLAKFRQLAGEENEEEEEEMNEKTLTPAELKKREEIAKAIKRENPNMPMAKKMAIATATAKKVAEETEQVDESSDPRRVRDELKSQGKHKEAGEHAYKHGLGRSYGPHFGMRSSKNSAEMEFHKGYDHAKAREDRAARLKNKEDGNRMFMGVAGQPYKEEVEQIDEYNTKSSKAIVTKDDKPVAIYPDLKSAQKDYYGKDGHSIGMRSHSAAERIRKANPGIKIVESVEKINEISKKTLSSYVPKAALSSTNAGVSMASSKSDEDKKRHARTIGKRIHGIFRAANRLAKEEVEQIDEISADLAHDVYKKRMAQAKAHVRQDNYSAARKAEKKAGETHLRMVKKILRREETNPSVKQFISSLFYPNNKNDK